MLKYQLFDQLRPEEFTALKQDIRERGVLVPVEVDERGRILDGHNREKIAKELGVRYKTIIRKFKNEKEKLEHVLKINLLRRHLGPISWAEAFKKLCEVRGVKLQQGSRNDLKGTSVAEIACELGVSRRSAQRRLRLANDLEPYPDLQDKVDTGEMEAKKAIIEIKKRNHSSKSKKHSKHRLPNSIRIECCDFRKLELNDNSVDLIFTGIPYTEKHAVLWKALSQFAFSKLKSGALLVTYCGQFWLDDVIKQLNTCLRYVWMGVVTHQAHLNHYSRKIHSGFKPILFFAKNEYVPQSWFCDIMRGQGSTKFNHEWEDPIEEAEKFIKIFTDTQGLVVDPFVGSGTTAIAAKHLNRKFVGCDIDRKAVQHAKCRVNNDKNEIHD
jgi:site-specific DNA-methyltransferase (adenine-specific)